MRIAGNRPIGHMCTGATHASWILSSMRSSAESCSTLGAGSQAGRIDAAGLLPAAWFVDWWDVLSSEPDTFA